jgi:hypothetical protein
MRQEANPRYHHATVDAHRAAATFVEVPEGCHMRGELQECHNRSPALLASGEYQESITTSIADDRANPLKNPRISHSMTVAERRCRR